MRHGRPTEAEILARACPPEVMYPDDVAVCLRLDGGASEAMRLLEAGALGPVVRVAGRIAVLRRDLLASLRGRVAAPPTVIA